MCRLLKEDNPLLCQCSAPYALAVAGYEHTCTNLAARGGVRGVSLGAFQPPRAGRPVSRERQLPRAESLCLRGSNWRVVVGGVPDKPAPTKPAKIIGFLNLIFSVSYI